MLLVWVTAPGAQHAGAATLFQLWLVVMEPVCPRGHESVPGTGAGAGPQTGGGAAQVFETREDVPVSAQALHAFQVGAPVGAVQVDVRDRD